MRPFCEKCNNTGLSPGEALRRIKWRELFENLDDISKPKAEAVRKPHVHEIIPTVRPTPDPYAPILIKGHW